MAGYRRFRKTIRSILQVANPSYYELNLAKKGKEVAAGKEKKQGKLRNLGLGSLGLSPITP